MRKIVLCYNTINGTTCSFVRKRGGIVSERKTMTEGNKAVGKNLTPGRKEPKQISFRVSESEYSKLQASAETLNMSVPLFVKNKAQGARLVAPKLDKVTRQSMAQDLGKLGSNLNQIAKALNTYDERVINQEMRQDIAMMRKELNHIWQQLK